MPVMAQTPTHQLKPTATPNTGWGLGFDLPGIGADYGVGMTITTPTFYKDILAIRMRYNRINNHGSQYTLGLLGFDGMAGAVRLYGEGGFLMNYKTQNIDGVTAGIGIYAQFGFEFFPASHNCYFIEMGIIDHNGVVETPTGVDYFGGAFISRVGFRYFFRKKERS